MPGRSDEGRPIFIAAAPYENSILKQHRAEWIPHSAAGAAPAPMGVEPDFADGRCGMARL
jgi:hypothetical protein